MALVEVKVAGINYADIMARSGIYPPISNTPFSPGFEISGVITQLGRGLTNFAIGDAVVGLNFGAAAIARMPLSLSNSFINCRPVATSLSRRLCWCKD